MIFPLLNSTFSCPSPPPWTEILFNGNKDLLQPPTAAPVIPGFCCAQSSLLTSPALIFGGVSSQGKSSFNGWNVLPTEELLLLCKSLCWFSWRRGLGFHGKLSVYENVNW